jgi:hypothetical protein
MKASNAIVYIGFFLFCLSAHAFVEQVSPGQALISITPASFFKHNPSAERKDIIEFISKQSSHQQHFKQKQLDQAWEEAPVDSCAMRVQIVGQNVYADAKNIEGLGGAVQVRVRAIISYLQALVQRYFIADVDLLIHLCDEVRTDFATVPAFIMSKNNASPLEAKLLLFPDIYMLDKGWGETISVIKEARGQYRWEEKEAKLFWRGAATGGLYDIANMAKLPRLSLVILSKLYPDIIDAEFVATPAKEATQGEKNLQQVLNLMFTEGGGHVPEAAHLKYKYLMSLDGNTCAWKRLPWIMYSNSVLVKQETSKEQWFYAAIRPYRHYVPTNERLTDLLAQIEWMQRNPDELKKIAAHAHRFVANNLMPEHIEAHMVLILNEYHKLHANEEIKPSLHQAPAFLMKIEEVRSKRSFSKRVKFFVKSWFAQLSTGLPSLP